MSRRSSDWSIQKWFLSLWYVLRKPYTYLVSRLPLCPKGPKRASTWVLSPNGIIRCVQNDFWAFGTSSANHAPILHRHIHCLQMERREIPHDPCHLGVPSGASKIISEPMERSMQTMHLSCAKIALSLNKPSSLDPRHLGVPSGASEMISERWYV
jgi:hypothetical protein